MLNKLAFDTLVSLQICRLFGVTPVDLQPQTTIFSLLNGWTANAAYVYCECFKKQTSEDCLVFLAYVCRKIGYLLLM
jgi:hypothetical protein